MVYYKAVKTTINASKLEKFIIDFVIKYYNFFNLIVIDKSSFFKLKFWLLLCFFFNIKKQLFTEFHLSNNS